MKRLFKYIGLGITFIILVFMILYFNNKIGTFKSNIEKDARYSQKVPDNWNVSESKTDNIAAMIFYDNSNSNNIFSIYVNRKGFSFGYFFINGGSFPVDDSVLEFNIEEYNEKVLISMNKKKVSKIKIDNGHTIKTVHIDSTKPFSYILPKDEGDITIYDINDNVVKSIAQ